jgi:hypothetical protein
MAQSRKRKKQSHGPDRLRRRRRERGKDKVPEGTEACPCGCGGLSVPAGRLTRTLDALWTPEDQEWTDRAAEAEARGDARAALEAYGHTPQVSGNLWPVQLEYLARVGDAAPEWLVARWVRAQAVRWMLLNEDPRIQSAVVDALVTHELPDEITADWLKEYGSMVAANDLLCHELALHAESGFEDFLDLRASDELLARAGRVREWPNQPLGVYEYVDVERDVLIVRDLVTGDRRDVLHLGAITGVDRDALVFGRLVPVETAPRLMFEHRPIEVDPWTAGRLVDDLDEGTVAGVLHHVAEAAADGRMPWRPGTRVGTHLWSDALIVDERFEELAESEPELIESTGPQGIVRDWIEEGVPEALAVALATCQLALTLADAMPEALPVAATHAATNLSIPAVLDAAREHLTPPEHAAAWRTFAEYVQEPLRSQCHDLASLAAAKSPATIAHTN